MDCPRCKLSLTASEYEGESVHFCGNCWGYWLSRPKLLRIARGIDYSFAKEETRAVQQVFAQEGDANRQGTEAEPIGCPECGTMMEIKLYSDRCPVKIDECQEHGIWLDTGEIKDLQVFIEQSLL